MIIPANNITLLKRLCEVFGLDPKTVRRLTLSIADDELVKLHVEKYVEAYEGEELSRALSEYANGVCIVTESRCTCGRDDPDYNGYRNDFRCPKHDD